MNRTLSIRLLVALSMFAAAQQHASGEEDTEAQDQPAAQKVEIQGKLVKNPTWISYWKTYRAMDGYLKAVKPGDPLEPRFQLFPIKADPPKSADLKLHLVSDSVDQNIPLDHYWGTVPLNKTAFDEKGDFYSNAPQGAFELQRHIALQRSTEGKYAMAYLKTACERALDVTKNLNPLYRVMMAFKKCHGAMIIAATDAGEVESNNAAVKIGKLDSAAPREYSRFYIPFGATDDDTIITTPKELIAIVPDIH